MPDLSPYFALSNDQMMMAALALIALIFASMAWLKLRRPWFSHLQRKTFLTANEAEFFQRLQRALPGYHVFPQVAFAALMTDDGRLSAKAHWSIRARFDRKIADYVICDRGLRVVALVELDDRTHNASADRQRDAITKAAGYQTLRFSSRQKPSHTEIAALFEHARAWTAA